jgi:hypothetical protein
MSKTKNKILRELIHRFVRNMSDEAIDSFCERFRFEPPLTPRLKRSFDRWYDKAMKGK